MNNYNQYPIQCNMDNKEVYHIVLPQKNFHLLNYLDNNNLHLQILQNLNNMYFPYIQHNIP